MSTVFALIRDCSFFHSECLSLRAPSPPVTHSPFSQRLGNGTHCIGSADGNSIEVDVSLAAEVSFVVCLSSFYATQAHCVAVSRHFEKTAKSRERKKNPRF